jgi:hypothetical protein
MIREARVEEWCEMFNLLRDPARTQAEKNVKASKVEVAAKILHRNWIEWAGPGAATYYLHVLSEHAGEQIRVTPSDLWEASGEAVEHHGRRVRNVIR